MSDNLKQSLERIRDEKAEEYVDAWTKKQVAFYNGQTLIMKEHFRPGFDAATDLLLPGLQEMRGALKFCNARANKAGVRVTAAEKALERLQRLEGKE